MPTTSSNNMIIRLVDIMFQSTCCIVGEQTHYKNIALIHTDVSLGFLFTANLQQISKPLESFRFCSRSFNGLF